MNINNLFQNAVITRLAGAVSAGTDGAFVTSLAEIDTRGYTGIAIVAQLGTVTSGGVFTLRAKNSSTSATYGAGTVDRIAQAALTDGTSKFVALDINRPKRRYIRAEYQRTVANVAIEAVYVILYNAELNPVTQSDLAALATVNDPTPLTA